MTLSHAHRGRSLEDLINYANDQYRARGIADIEKQPVPARFIGGGRVIPVKSGVDYEGIFQGLRVVFEAKQTHLKSFPLRLVKDHQYQRLLAASVGGHRSFLLVEVLAGSKRAHVRLIPFQDLDYYWCRAKAGGRASISADELDELPQVTQGRGIVLDYLGALERMGSA